jgi:hypothetical protein
LAVLLLAMILVAAVLVGYILIEKRINLRECPECGFKVSIDSPAGDCPRCRPVLDQDWQEVEADDPFSPQRLSNRLVRNWPRLVFACVPLAIVIGAGGILMAERFQSDVDKAIRLVKESNSRKENFTVQQYLYATIYYRRDQGDAVTIEGWRAETSQPDAPIKVEFSYSDEEGRHSAIWEAGLREGRVTPGNEIARDISWH